MIGLGLVLILIALAAAVLRNVTREKPLSVPGGAKPDMVVNMTLGNELGASAGLADMGVAPGVANASASR